MQPTGIREQLTKSEEIKWERSLRNMEVQHSKRNLDLLENGIESQESWVYVPAVILTDHFFLLESPFPHP